MTPQRLDARTSDAERHGDLSAGQPHETAPRNALQRVIAAVLRLRLVRAVLLYIEQNGPLLADSITYRALFSVFAAVLLGVSLAGIWLSDNPEAILALNNTLDRVIPGIGEFVDPATSGMTVGFTLIGLISLIGLVSAAISAIGSLRVALHMIADEFSDELSPVWVILRNLLVAVCFGGLLGLAAAATFVSELGVHSIANRFGLAESEAGVQLLIRLTGVVAVFVIDTLAVALMFRMLSGVRVTASSLWLGAMLGGVGLTILQELSGLFVRGATSNPLLASFASLIALLLWFNLSAQVILIASSFILTRSHEVSDRKNEARPVSSVAQLRLRHAEERFQRAQDALRLAQEAELAERKRQNERHDSHEHS